VSIEYCCISTANSIASGGQGANKYPNNVATLAYCVKIGWGIIYDVIVFVPSLSFLDTVSIQSYTAVTTLARLRIPSIDNSNSNCII
jgi:hypothetical protein